MNWRHRHAVEERAAEIMDEEHLTWSEAHARAYEEYYAEMEHRWEAKQDR